MISNLAAKLITRSGSGAIWQITWSGSADLYYVFVDGLLLLTTTATFADITVGPGQTPVIDVLDDPAKQLAPIYPAAVTLAWYSAGAGVASYRIDRLVGTTWIEQISLPEAWYQTWTSGTLADDAVHTYRIVPIGINGNAGTASQFAALMVRRPDVPTLSMAYNATTNVLTLS